MATSDISKVAVIDPRIHQLPSRYAVDKGALSNTCSPYSAISATASQHTYNINVPSQNVFIDRAVQWSSDVALTFAVDCTPAGAVPGSADPIVKFGVDCALAPFPLHQLVSTLTATINDCSITSNTADVIAELLRLTDYRVNRLQRTCPTMLDVYQSYNDAFQTINNPLAGYGESADPGKVPNGAWWNVVFTDASGAPLVAQNLAGNFGFYQVTGGNWIAFLPPFSALNASPYAIPVRSNAQAGAPGALVADNAYAIYMKFGSTEKLLLSPFIFADGSEYETGLFGKCDIPFECGNIATAVVVA